MTRHNDIIYLRHMRDHAREAIDLLGPLPRDHFSESRTLQLALLHLVEIVGEAATRVSPETRAELALIPWREIVAMRNRIIHGYATVSCTMLWDTVADDLPVLVNLLDQYLVLGDTPQESAAGPTSP